MRGGVVLNKFYLNGEIIDRYRHIFTGRAAITNCGEVSRDKNYFYKYEHILEKRLSDKNNIVFSMSRYTIFNPVNLPYSGYSAKYADWEWADFFMHDIKELCNGHYDYMVFLPGWWKSKESWSKLLVAKGIGVKVITFKKLLKELS